MNILRLVSRAVERVSGQRAPDPNPAQRVILMYHGVAETPCFNCVTIERFHEQLAYVQAHYQVVPLTELIGRVLTRAVTESPLLALTFDDAYENFLTAAHPVLRELKLPAGLAIPTGHVGGVNQWDIDRGHPTLKLLSWPQLRELDSFFIEFGSHSVTHRSFGALSQAEIGEEIRRSKDVIEQTLGCPVRWLAFPYGKLMDLNPAAGPILGEAGYLGACSTRWGRFNHPADRYALRRIDVWEDDTLEDFRAKLSGHYDWLAPKEALAFGVRRLAGRRRRR